MKVPTVREKAAGSQESWAGEVVLKVWPMMCSGAIDWARQAWVRSWAATMVAMKRVSWRGVKCGGWGAVGTRERDLERGFEREGAGLGTYADAGAVGWRVRLVGGVDWGLLEVGRRLLWCASAGVGECSGAIAAGVLVSFVTFCQQVVRSSEVRSCKDYVALKIRSPSSVISESRTPACSSVIFLRCTACSLARIARHGTYFLLQSQHVLEGYTINDATRSPCPLWRRAFVIPYLIIVLLSVLEDTRKCFAAHLCRHVQLVDRPSGIIVRSCEIRL